MAKPTETTEWANDVGALITATDTTRWDLGWMTKPNNLETEIGEMPNLQQQNYWQNAVHKWKEYLESTTDTNTSDISTNATNIGTNATNIGTNATNISLLERPVGSIESSFLTVAQFNAQPGHGAAKWVLCDGGSAVGSLYETVTGEATVPDIRNRFLRNTGGSTVLGELQSSAVGNHTHPVDGSVMSAALSFKDGKVAFKSSPRGFTSDRKWTAAGTTDSAESIVYTSSVEVEGSTGGVANTTTESKPNNVTVNMFIKIN